MTLTKTDMNQYFCKVNARQQERGRGRYHRCVTSAIGDMEPAGVQVYVARKDNPEPGLLGVVAIPRPSSIDALAAAKFAELMIAAPSLFVGASSEGGHESRIVPPMHPRNKFIKVKVFARPAPSRETPDEIVAAATTD